MENTAMYVRIVNPAGAALVLVVKAPSTAVAREISAAENFRRKVRRKGGIAIGARRDFSSQIGRQRCDGK